MKKLIGILSLLLTFTLPSIGQVPMAVVHDPMEAVSGLEPLNTLEDAEMEQALMAELSEHAGWGRLIREKKLSVAIVDLHDPENVRFADVNGDEMMYAASLPKIAVLLAAMDAIDAGELTVTEEVRHDMRIMISKSDNSAATRMIDRLGYDKIADVMTDPRYKLYDESQGGGLWVGKRYARAGERNPDPMKGLSHAATATQVARYYYLMAHGQLVSPERSAEMLEIMKDPKLHHKFVNTLDRVAPNAELYRKSGSWSTFHSDSVMVWDESGWRKYILVALVNDPNGETICRQLVTEVEEVLRAQPSRTGSVEGK